MAPEPPARRIGRMLTLVPWLSARPGVTLEETAAHFGITVDVLEADLWQLILCGVPGYGPDQLVDIDFWDDGAIFVHDAQTLIAPLRLSPEESTALVLGLHAIAQAPGLDNDTAFLSAAAKIEGALLTGSLAPEILPASDVGDDVTVALDAAVSGKTAVELHYGSAGEEVTIRTVWPQQVISIDGIPYVSGWCEYAEAVRTFRMDRILSARPVSGRTSVPDLPPVTWWEGLSPHRAVVELPAKMRWVLEEAAAVEMVEEVQGTVRAAIGFANAEWVAAWVLRHGGCLTVLEPSWVRDVVREHAERLIGSATPADG